MVAGNGFLYQCTGNFKRHIVHDITGVQVARPNGSILSLIDV